MAMLSAEKKVLQLLNKAAVAGERLASLLSVTTKLQTIEREQENIERVARSNPDLDPMIAEEIRELNRKFRSCISCAKVFLMECRSAVEYGLNEEIEKTVKVELKQGKLDTLESFLIHLVNRLKQSKDQLENFNRSRSEANEIAKEMTTKYKIKLNTVTRDVDAAREQYGTASLLGSVATVTKVASGVSLVGGVMMIGWRPQAALVMSIASGTVAYGSFVVEHVAASYTLAAMNKLNRSVTEQSNFEKALHSIKYIETLETNEKQIPTAGEFKDISQGLDSLLTILRSMSKEIGDVRRESSGTEIRPQPKLYTSKTHPSSLYTQKPLILI